MSVAGREVIRYTWFCAARTSGFAPSASGFATASAPLLASPHRICLCDLVTCLHLLLRRLLLYDYSGYGASTGKPSEFNTYYDIEAVYNCLKSDYEIRQEDLIVYGQSVGSGPTLHLASQLKKLRAVVLHSAILSGIRVLYPVRLTFWFDIFKNIDKIRHVSCPVLVIHVSTYFLHSFETILFEYHSFRIQRVCAVVLMSLIFPPLPSTSCLISLILSLHHLLFSVC
nr:uncharacterized protein LOC103406951 [Malus domestica]